MPVNCQQITIPAYYYLDLNKNSRKINNLRSHAHENALMNKKCVFKNDK